MYVHLLLVVKKLWCATTEGSFILKGNDDVVTHPNYWNDSETKKVSYDLKARNILVSALSTKVFYLISHHTSDKCM